VIRYEDAGLMSGPGRPAGVMRDGGSPD